MTTSVRLPLANELVQAAEDDADAIPCLCGSPACQKFL